MPKERGNNSSIKDPKGSQYYKFKSWGHKISDCHNKRVVVVCEGEPYYNDEVGQAEGNEQEYCDIGVDKKDQDPYKRKITIYIGLMMRVQIEKRLSQEGELMVPNYVMRKVIISKSMDDPSQKENLFHSKCLIKKC